MINTAINNQGDLVGQWNKTRKTYPYKECHQNEAEIISMGKGWKKCCNDEAEIWMKE